MAGLVEQLAGRHVPALLRRFDADDGGLAGVVARAPAIAGADDVFDRRRHQGSVQLLVPVHQRVIASSPQGGEGRVTSQLAVGPFLQDRALDPLGIFNPGKG